MAQAHVDAPVEAVWGLIGDPRKYPDWWPPIVGVSGDDFEVGAVHRQQWRVLGRTVEYSRIIERRDELRELEWRCPTIGTYCRWPLTPAEGGTFIEMHMGVEPLAPRYRVLDSAVMGPFYLRRWIDQALEGLRQALSQQRGPA